MYFIFNLLIAVPIYFDAKKFRKQGLKIAPIIWAAGALAFSIFILPLYWMMRYAVWDVQVKAIQDPTFEKVKIRKKISFRIAVYLIGLFLFLLLSGCDKPFWAHFIHGKIKVGMSAGEVAGVIGGQRGIVYNIQLINPVKYEWCKKTEPEFDACYEKITVTKDDFKNTGVDANFVFKSLTDSGLAVLINESTLSITSKTIGSNSMWDVFKTRLSSVLPIFQTVQTRRFSNCAERFSEYRIDCESNKKLLHGIQGQEEFVRIINDVKDNKEYVIGEASIFVCLMGPMFLHNSFDIIFNSDGKVKFVSPVKHWD